MHINNTQFAILEASEDFMVTALVLVSGIVTDRIGGASMRPILTFCSALMLENRGNFVRERHLHHRLYICCCSYNSPLVSLHDFWPSGSCTRRHRDPDCSVQDLFVVVSTK